MAVLVSLPDTGGQRYLHALSTLNIGGHGLYCPPAKDKGYDALILTGGGDIAPAYYFEESKGSQPPDIARDAAEFALVYAFVAQKKPIFGICRGMQLLNVFFGGSLIQDLPPSQQEIHLGENEQDKLHPISFCANTPLFDALGTGGIVNSWHHQAVGTLGENLIPAAWADDGVLEGFFHKSLPILGVQFHPERIPPATPQCPTLDGLNLFRLFTSWI